VTTAVPVPVMNAEVEPKGDEAARRKAANLKTALVLLSIAVVFFVGIIASKFMGSPTTSISIIGAAVLLYLVVAIGRNLRK
jgi:hypothetical protein